MAIYRNFLIYKDGIYEILDDDIRLMGGHAVKIIGWDKDQNNGRNYWIIENTWNESWGIKGLAKVYAK